MPWASPGACGEELLPMHGQSIEILAQFMDRQRRRSYHSWSKGLMSPKAHRVSSSPRDILRVVLAKVRGNMCTFPRANGHFPALELFLQIPAYNGGRTRDNDLTSLRLLLDP